MADAHREELPLAVCSDCGHLGCCGVHRGALVPASLSHWDPLVPEGPALHLCPDCWDMRTAWFDRFGTPMERTPDFLARMGRDALKNLNPSKDSHLEFIHKTIHLMRSLFLAPDEDWSIVENNGFIVAVRLDPRTHVQVILNFRTGAALGCIVKEHEYLHTKIPKDVIPRMALRLDDWNDILGWLFLARTTWDRELKNWGHTIHKLLRDVVFDGKVYRCGSFVDIRIDKGAFRPSQLGGGGAWIGNAETVSTLLDVAPEGVSDWSWDLDDDKEREK